MCIFRYDIDPAKVRTGNDMSNYSGMLCDMFFADVENEPFHKMRQDSSSCLILFVRTAVSPRMRFVVCPAACPHAGSYADSPWRRGHLPPCVPGEFPDSRDGRGFLWGCLPSCSCRQRYGFILVVRLIEGSFLSLHSLFGEIILTLRY